LKIKVYIGYYIYIIGYKQHPRRKMDEVNVATPIMATATPFTVTPKRRPSMHDGNAPNKESRMAHMPILTPRVIAFPDGVVGAELDDRVPPLPNNETTETFVEAELSEYGSNMANPGFQSNVACFFT
jgi:hypothetical protein